VNQGGFGQGWGRTYLFDFLKAGLTEGHPSIDRTPCNGSLNIRLIDKATE
jgi:hypothetical protein